MPRGILAWSDDDTLSCGVAYSQLRLNPVEVDRHNRRSMCRSAMSQNGNIYRRQGNRSLLLLANADRPDASPSPKVQHPGGMVKL